MLAVSTVNVPWALVVKPAGNATVSVMTAWPSSQRVTSRLADEGAGQSRLTSGLSVGTERPLAALFLVGHDFQALSALLS